ncbi:MAG: hypothetical protein JOZ41_16845, partial [Chloroflexi bacterium]|nr:hypothetical protein [Chloroflexota bacterium]
MKRRGVRRLVGGATVALLGLCLSSQGVAAAAPSATGVTAASGVTMTVDAGWNGVYRGQPAWTPIRVAFQNQNSESVAGTVEILDTSIADAVQSGRRAVADYDQSVLLPAGQARRVTLYVPGADLNGQVTVTFRVGGRALLSTTVFPTALRDTDLTIAAVTSQPQSLAWLHQLRLPGTRVVAASLDPSALDPLPEALASFDLIVISNVNAAQLDQDQLVALDRYVRNGGSVLLVGGPDWAETLAPLGQLLPGSLTGSRIEPGLPGLASLGEGEPPPRPTTVSRLAPGSGAILAGDASLPLVVRAPRGNGTIQYLAFDPSVEPIPHWSGAERLLSGLVRGAMTQAMRRLTLPDGYGSVSFLKPAGGEVDAAREIAGLPSASPTVLLILAGITTLYVLLAGPVGFAALRRARRPALTWMAVPALSLVFGTGVIGVATQAKGRALAVNTIGMVQLDGPADRYPGTFYVGLTVPGPGRYRLTYDRPALASPSLPDTSTAQTPSARATTPEWRLDEGVQPGITLPVTDDWTERAAAVRTAVDAAGTVSANLHLDAQGDVVGTIHNGTRLTLLH